MMFSSRVVSFLLLLITFGMFVAATPVDSAGVVARDKSLIDSKHVDMVRSPNLVARSGTCNTGGCNEQEILDVLIQLKIDIDVQIGLLDGVNEPEGPCNEIISLINAAISILIDIDVNISVVGALVGQIINIIVHILVSIVLALIKYNILLIVDICLRIDICLSAFLRVCIALIPGCRGLIVGSLTNIDIFASLNLVLTLGVLGL